MNGSIYSLEQLRSLARRLDRTVNHTPCHSENVANLALELCRALGIRGKKKDKIITACLIHDIGKVVVDSQIWLKKEQLSNTDWLRIKMHPLISAQLARQGGCSKEIIEYIYYHHVWFNGNGYPDEAYKKGRRIPIGARILAICDAYEAMRSERPYREKMLPEEAINELRNFSIKQFDPKIVEVFLRVIKAN